MSYQKCPRCEGSGKKFNFIPTGVWWFDLAVTMPVLRINGDKMEIDDPTKEVCPVCKGKMIISTETGLPPSE